MPRTTLSGLHESVLGYLQRVSQDTPAAVPAALVQEFDTAAGELQTLFQAGNRLPDKYLLGECTLL
jgi:hypothetical protein